MLKHVNCGINVSELYSNQIKYVYFRQLLYDMIRRTQSIIIDDK